MSQKLCKLISDTLCNIAQAVGISLSRAHFILECILKVQKISARPHLLTNEQNGYKFPKFNQRQFANFVTGEKVMDALFRPVRKIGNKIWLTLHVHDLLLSKGL